MANGDNQDTGKVTRAEFAAKLKAKYPQYTNVPDDQLVDKVLARYPTYKDRLQEKTAGPAQPIMRAPNTIQLPRYGRRIDPSESPSAASAAEDALPMIGGALAAAAVPEGAPFWISLLASSGGALGGSTAKSLAKNPREIPDPMDVVSDTFFQGALPELTGGATGLLGKAIGRTSAVAPGTDALLQRMGIQLTKGEKMGPGLFSSAERTVGEFGSGQKRASEFIADRQAKIATAGEQAASSILKGIAPFPEQNRTNQILYDVASNLMAQGDSDVVMANQKLAEQATNARATGRLQLGQSIINAVRANEETAHVAEDALYAEKKPLIKDFPVTYAETTPLAKDFLKEYYGGLSAGAARTPELQPLLNSVRVMAGQSKVSPELDGLAVRWFGGHFNELSTDDQAKAVLQAIHAFGPKSVETASEPLDRPFSDVWEARKSVGQEIGKLRARGDIGGNRLRVANELYGALTNDMLRALPPDLKDAFLTATSMTAARKELFASSFLKSMLNKNDPVAPEAVVRTLMEEGNEQDFRDVVRVVGANSPEIARLRRFTADHVMKKYPFAVDALKFLEGKPGMRYLMGSDYGPFEKGLMELADKQETLNQKSLHYMLKTTKSLTVRETGRTGTLRLVNNIFASPSYEQRISQMLRGSPQAKQELAEELFRKSLDDATTGGAFGFDGAHFNPKKFAEGWGEARPKIEPFVDRETLRNLDSFVGAMKALHFDPTIGKSSFDVRRIIYGLSNATVVSGLGVGILSRNPYYGILAALATGLGAPAATYIGPKMFLKFALSPTGSKLLSEGIHLGPGTQAYAEWSVRVANYMWKVQNNVQDLKVDKNLGKQADEMQRRANQ